MSDVNKERLLDLLTDQVLFGLNEAELAELNVLKAAFPDFEADNSLELTAVALGLTGLNEIEPMPDHLKAAIAANSESHFATQEKRAKVLRFEPPQKELKNVDIAEDIQKTFEFKPKRPFVQWLGWAFAGLASIVLAFTLLQPPKTIEIVKEVPPRVLTPSENYETLLSSAKDIKRTFWENPKDGNEKFGEIIWSESEQKGFMKLNGFPSNDAAKECYQLWIFDETQSDKTPIDGGVFNVTSGGEIIIPIDAKLKFKNPKMFAVTVEKPGGVVVSAREKIVALGKVQV